MHLEIIKGPYSFDSLVRQVMLLVTSNDFGDRLQLWDTSDPSQKTVCCLLI